MSLKESLARKSRLSLAQLASYDDILTDALVDHVRAPLLLQKRVLISIGLFLDEYSKES